MNIGHEIRVVVWAIPGDVIPNAAGEVQVRDVNYASNPQLFQYLNSGYTIASHTLGSLGEDAVISFVLTKPIDIPDTTATITLEGH